MTDSVPSAASPETMAAPPVDDDVAPPAAAVAPPKAVEPPPADAEIVRRVGADLPKRMPSAAFAFRGYNVTNLGRTPELLAHPNYGPILTEYLGRASDACAEATGRAVNLAERVRREALSTLASYPEDIALSVAVSLAEIELLRTFHGGAFDEARFAFGYSLGEVAAVAAAGVFEMEAVLEPLLELAPDAADLAHDVEMGVLFSRGPALDVRKVERHCLELTAEGRGVIAIMSYLAPNTVLLLGQGETIPRFRDTMHDVLPAPVHLRGNPHRWPPMHTPIVWQRNISNRAGVLMHTAAGGFRKPKPAVLSCVTGDASYDEMNSRSILMRWVDHPQRLWDVIERTLAEGVDLVIHVGPEPNIVPATYARLSNNVATQLNARTLGGFGMRAMSHIVRRSRPWLRSLMSKDAALLRAPFIEQVILQDWLLEQTVK
ncbi:MAG: hypothetical protein WD066_02120 [Planctomycetaceae bacterium]